MISENDILKILERHKRKANYSWESSHIISSDFSLIAKEIMDLLSYYFNVENAELSAKVKAYEAIIENSNFKMAIQRKKKGGKE